MPEDSQGKYRYSGEVTFFAFQIGTLQCLQIAKYVFIFAYHITPRDIMLDRISCFSIMQCSLSLSSLGNEDCKEGGFFFFTPKLSLGKKSHCRWKSWRKEHLLWVSVKEMCSVSIYNEMVVITLLQLSVWLTLAIFWPSLCFPLFWVHYLVMVAFIMCSWVLT